MKTLFYLFVKLTLLVCFISIIGLPNLYAQQNLDNIVTYDLIYLKNGRVLKGEILVFEEKDGDITFRDTWGRKYSLTRDDYNYFIEDKRYLVNVSDTIYIKARKDSEYEFSIGFSGAFLNIKPQLKPDDVYLNTADSYADLPLSLHVGFGKYINRQNFVGINANLGIASESKNYFSFGLRYFHQYDAYKRNMSFYIPMELQFNTMRYPMNYTLADSTDMGGGNYLDITSDRDIEASFQSIGFNVGQGVTFMLENKKSVSVELTLFKYYIISEKYFDLEHHEPKNDVSLNGIKLSLFYNI